VCDELARKVREKGKVLGVSVLSSLPKYSGLRPRRSCTFVAAELRLCMSSAKRTYTRQVDPWLIQIVTKIGRVAQTSSVCERCACRYESNEDRSSNSWRPTYKTKRVWGPQ
jgi:hypothetical protein